MNNDDKAPLLGIQNDRCAAAPLSDSERYLGRRIESDGSWTMYHVFTGVPARLNNRIMTGLTRSEVTAAMIRRRAESSIK